MNTRHREHWLVRPQSIKALWIGFIVVLLLVVLGDFFIHTHVAFEIDGTFGFYAWYGLVTCIAMIVAAKALALLLKRPDDYYDAGTRPEVTATRRDD